MGNDEIKVLSFNIFNENKQYQKITNVINEIDADIVLLVEANQHLKDEIIGLGQYPYRADCSENKRCALMMLSKYPLIETVVDYIDEIRLPYIKTKVKKANKTLNILGTHLARPWPYDNIQSQQYEYLSKNVNYENLIFLGDLNSLSIFPSLISFLNQKKLSKDKVSRGTFPYDFWSPFRFKIDYITASEDLNIISSEIYLGNTGSDHLPLSTTIGF